MNLRNCALLVVVLGLALAGSLARAQDLPTAATTLTTADENKIDSFVQQQAGRLVGSASAKDRKEAREAMTGVFNKPDTSSAFIEHYAESVNKNLLPLAKDADYRARLNAAIVLAKVAEKAESTALQTAVEAFLQDSCEPVLIWALQAARPTVTAVYRTPLLIPGNKLVPAIVAALKNHPSGLVAGAAYDAMSMEVLNPAAVRKPTGEMLKAALPVVQQLLAMRVEQYRTSWPGDPAAEGSAVSFLSATPVWNAVNAQQQAQSVQLLVDLVTLAVQHAERQPAKREELMPLISRTGSAIMVVGQLVNNSAVVTAAAPLQRNTWHQGLANDAKAVFEALKGVPQFKALKPPPELTPAAQRVITTAPANGGGGATGPTTAP